MATEYDFENQKQCRIVREGIKPPSSNYYDLACGHCGTVSRAYWWSLAGSGKKCENRACGALMLSSCMAAPVKRRAT